MITKELIDRINELSRKQRSVGLTAKEIDEQAKLREKYLQEIRKQVTDSLETMKVTGEKHNKSCSCGHCHPNNPKQSH